MTSNTTFFSIQLKFKGEDKFYQWTGKFISGLVKFGSALVKYSSALVKFSSALVKIYQWTATGGFDPSGTP